MAWKELAINLPWDLLLSDGVCASIPLICISLTVLVNQWNEAEVTLKFPILDFQRPFRYFSFADLRAP